MEAAVWNGLVSGVVRETWEAALNGVTSAVVVTRVIAHACAGRRRAEIRTAIRGLGLARIRSLVSQIRQRNVPVELLTILKAVLPKS